MASMVTPQKLYGGELGQLLKIFKWDDNGTQTAERILCGVETGRENVSDAPVGYNALDVGDVALDRRQLGMQTAGGLLPSAWVLGWKLYVGPPVHEGGTEVPGRKAVLVSVRGYLGDVTAAPVDMADTRPVPEVGGVPPAQEHVLVALTTAPAVLPQLGAGTMPHDKAGLTRFPGDEVLYVFMITR